MVDLFFNLYFHLLISISVPLHQSMKITNSGATSSIAYHAKFYHLVSSKLLTVGLSACVAMES